MNMAAEALKEINNMVVTGNEFINIFVDIERINAIAKCAYSYVDEAYCKGEDEIQKAKCIVQAIFKLIEDMSLKADNDVLECSKALIGLCCLENKAD